MQYGNTRYLSFGFITFPFVLDLCVPYALKQEHIQV